MKKENDFDWPHCSNSKWQTMTKLRLFIGGQTHFWQDMALSNPILWWVTIRCGPHPSKGSPKQSGSISAIYSLVTGRACNYLQVLCHILVWNILCLRDLSSKCAPWQNFLVGRVLTAECMLPHHSWAKVVIPQLGGHRIYQRAEWKHAIQVHKFIHNRESNINNWTELTEL